MFYFDRIVWVLHNRIVCGECGRTCASIDPRFLAKLPTRVTECFPFITTVGGPGMHQAMIFQFTNLLTKGIMYGTYVEDINRMQKYCKIMRNNIIVNVIDIYYTHKKFKFLISSKTKSVVLSNCRSLLWTYSMSNYLFVA